METLEEEIARFFKQEKYRDIISRAVVAGRKTVPVEFGDLLIFNKEIAEKIQAEPLIYLPLLDNAALKQLEFEYPDYAAVLKYFKTAVRGLPETIPIRKIRSEHLRKLIAVDGIVVRASTVRPLLEKGAFRCRYCGNLYRVDGVRPPPRCGNPRCRERRPSFELVEEESVFSDFQTLGIQEKPEDLPPGQLPRVIEVRVRGDAVDMAAPGDRVTVTGVLMLSAEQGEAASQARRIYLDSVSIEPRGKELESLLITPEEEKMFKEMAADPQHYQRLIESVAPSIQGLEHIKEAVLLLLFGGRSKVFPDGVRVRGDVHVLLVGDPGTAKSTLLLYAAQIAPRGVYTSGRGSTAAGLTAAVVRDAGGGLVLEAGASVLADMGICVIDEIDKMRPEDRVAMHEVMAQQTVSIAKGGIVATLNARCSILAAANPELGRYDVYRPFNENVNLPITLLSRFDLIYVLRDEPSPETDRKVSSHIVSLHVEGGVKKEPPIHPSILKKYIAYSKKIEPILTQEAAEILEQFYLSMRSVYEKTSTVSITARQLESLIRVAEARARACLRNVVTVEDAQVAVRLMKRSLSEVGIDVETGRPDIDVIMTGKPRSVREKLSLVLDVIRELQEQHGFADDEALKKELQQQGLTKAEIDRILNRMITEGRIYTPKPGAYRLA
ncbi:MAG: minichromosome maintenance protein MCM [Nitrososphaerota archaeon]|nr:minichromosome maintenance protein MCM [Candidatus Calditenuaceae archaeon]MDW8073121.1 minichromosome maintenance protein MCM [Nitrososphaerota archaeon]